MMKSLLLTTIIVCIWSLSNETISAATNLEQIEAPIAWVDYQDRGGEAGQLEKATSRIYKDSRRSRRHPRFDAYNKLRPESAYDGLNVQQSCPEEETAIIWSEVKTIEGEGADIPYPTGWLPPITTKHDCADCDQKPCQCPPYVCKAGNCNHNYAVVFGSKRNCLVCPRMYPVINELRSSGYIVFYVDTDDFPGVFAQFKFSKWPTTIVMENKKPVIRFHGVTTAKKIAKHMKTRDEQGL
jgi:hypothetical protein